MAGSVNKAILVSTEILASDYDAGFSLTDLSVRHGMPVSTIRFRLHKLGVLRSNKDAIKLAGKRGKMARRTRGSVSEEGRSNMRVAANIRWAGKARGIRTRPNGYVEYTLGRNKGRCVHVVIMEDRIGRRLKSDEVVHHIDGDRGNNAPNNLALMTRSAHARLHRFEDGLAGNLREREENGRFR